MNKNKPPFALNPLNALVVMLMMASPITMAADTDQKNGSADQESTTKKATDAKSSKASADKKVLPELTVTTKVAKREQTESEKYKLPNTTATVTAEDIKESVNMTTAEDAVKYLPSLVVRRRYIGDTNAPLATRTTGTSSSARTLIYADGILLSSLLANNNSNTGSPLWKTISPGEIERMDMLYGPYSAAYAGNSMGGVLNITTKMPTKFEAGADTQGSYSNYNVYNHQGSAYNENYSAHIGDKYKDAAFRFDFNHLDSVSQPITFQTGTIPGNTTSLTGATPVNGAILSKNPTNAAIDVMGAGAINHTLQDNFKWKLAYDITPTIKASYTLGMWQNSATSGVNSWLTNASTGSPVNSGLVNINGKAFNLNGTASPTNLNGTAATFSPSLIDQTTWSHGMSVKSNTGGKFDWELDGSLVDLGTDTSRAATQSPLATAQSPTGGTGRTTYLTGSNWNTADAKGIWRPGNFYGNHEVSFGFHNDFYQLVNPVYNTLNWQTGGNANMYSDSEGKTETQGYWAQDAWDFAKDWNFTAGARVEHWSAFDGLNSAIVGTSLATVNQSNRSAANISPKGKLTWTPRDDLKLGASMGQAFRYPTAAELFQTTSQTTGGVTTLVNGNPNLRPENVLSSELSSEYFLNKGSVRLSAFQERVNDAIYSTASLLPNNTVASYTTNIGQTDTFGLELAGNFKDVFIQNLNMSFSGTWADSAITENGAADAALAKQGATAANPQNGTATTGKMQPRIPAYRSTFTVSYKPMDKLTTSVSGRYSSKMYSNLNNSDTYGNTYTGNTEYFVVDTKVNYEITKQWSVNAGIDNINNQTYWIYHPFPQRTYMAQLKFNY